MNDIHLIEKAGLYNRVPGTEDEWTTGAWTMSEVTANSLVGGNVFLHTSQKGPCYLGGEILDCRLDHGTRYEIRFRFDPALVNTTTEHCSKNWSVEMLLQPVDRIVA